MPRPEQRDTQPEQLQNQVSPEHPNRGKLKTLERPNPEQRTSPNQDSYQFQPGLRDQTCREKAENAIEEMMRKQLGTKGSVIRDVQKKHVQTIIKSRAAQKTIGTDRGVKVWGWLARASREKRITLKLTTEWTNEWISAQEHMINSLRADEVWTEEHEQKSVARGAADRAEAIGAIKTWMMLNEEPTRNGILVLRSEKREAMRSSRSHLFKRMGGAEAMYAAIAIMTMTGEVVTETDRGMGGKRGASDDWVKRSLAWAMASDWITHTESETDIVAITLKRQDEMRSEIHQREGIGDHKILDIGEGWGSIGIAASEMVEGCSTIGVDRAGFLDQGHRYGTITSRVNMDLCSEGETNVLRRTAKAAGRKLESFTMVWLSPECRILTQGNSMNVNGHTNGKRLTDPRNDSTMPQHVKDIKMEELRQCEKAVENQMEALEQETGNILFAVENPATSDFWKMEAVTSRIQRQKAWRIVRTDQCAYGRKCKKPTNILTNIESWKPKGITGSGRCVILTCGGTKNNAPGKGQRQHEQQMISMDPNRKPREGERIEGTNRREYSIKAGKNLVIAGLVQEIIRAAIREREQEKRGNQEPTRPTKKRKTDGTTRDTGHTRISRDR